MSSKLFALAALLVVTMPLVARADWDSFTEPNPKEVDMHAWQNVNHISDRAYVRELELHGYTKEEATKIAHQRFQTEKEKTYMKLLIADGVSKSDAERVAHARFGNDLDREFAREDIKRMRIYAHSHLEGVDSHKMLQRAQRMENALNKVEASAGETGHSAAKSVR